MKKTKTSIIALSTVLLIAAGYAFAAKPYSSHVLYVGPLSGNSCTTRTTGVEIQAGTANQAASTTPLTTGCPHVKVITVTN
jgi:hypothetical protein